MLHWDVIQKMGSAGTPLLFLAEGIDTMTSEEAAQFIAKMHLIDTAFTQARENNAEQHEEDKKEEAQSAPVTQGGRLKFTQEKDF